MLENIPFLPYVDAAALRYHLLFQPIHHPSIHPFGSREIFYTSPVFIYLSEQSCLTKYINITRTLRKTSEPT